jgi:hypothetical protein
MVGYTQEIWDNVMSLQGALSDEFYLNKPDNFLLWAINVAAQDKGDGDCEGFADAMIDFWISFVDKPCKV